jgi:hypothetical protein
MAKGREAGGAREIEMSFIDQYQVATNENGGFRVDRISFDENGQFVSSDEGETSFNTRAEAEAEATEQREIAKKSRAEARKEIALRAELDAAEDEARG